MAQNGSLGSLALVPPESIEVAQKKLSISTDAMGAVAQYGVVFPTEASLGGYKGEMPRDLTRLDDNELGDILNKLSQWAGYLDSGVAQASIMMSEAEAYYEYIKARIRLQIKASYGDKRITVQDKNDFVNTDPRVIDAWNRVLYTTATFTLTRVIRDNAQKNWETVSRRITQRGQEVDRMRREGNVAGVPVTPRSFRRP